MVSKKLRWILIGIVIFVLAFGFYVLYDYSFVLKANWGFSIPRLSKYSQIYSADSGSSPHGDGIRFHIFSYKNEQYIDNMVDRDDGLQFSNLYDSSKDYIQTAEEWLDIIHVSLDYRPDYDNCLFWYTNKNGLDEIFLFVDKSKDLFYILESFI